MNYSLRRELRAFGNRRQFRLGLSIANKVAASGTAPAGTGFPNSSHGEFCGGRPREALETPFHLTQQYLHAAFRPALGFRHALSRQGEIPQEIKGASHGVRAGGSRARKGGGLVSGRGKSRAGPRSRTRGGHARRRRMAPLQGPRNSENHVASASSLLQHGAEFDGQRLRLTDIAPRLHQGVRHRRRGHGKFRNACPHSLAPARIALISRRRRAGTSPNRNTRPNELRARKRPMPKTIRKLV